MNEQKKARIVQILNVIEAALQSQEASDILRESGILAIIDHAADAINQMAEASDSFDILAKHLLHIFIPLAKASVEIADYVTYEAAGSVGVKQQRLRKFLLAVEKLDSDKSLSET